MKNKLFSKIIAIVLCLSVLFANMIFTLSVSAETTKPVIVVSGSDFQSDSSNEQDTNVPTTVPSAIFSQIKSAYSEIDGYLFAGDYTAKNSVEGSKRGLNVFKDLLESYFPNIEADDQVWGQGNHDPSDLVADGTLAPSGANDKADYGIFVINEDDYPGYGDAVGLVSETAASLKAYLNEKVQAEYTKPIFIVSHVSLHYSYRTYSQGCSLYASMILDLLNEASNAGLNIVYMYGHTHNNGYDDYLGGDEIFFTKGDVINVPTSKKTWEEREIEFTYLNAGYTAVYWAGHGSTSKWNTSMVVYEITDDTITFNRYGEKGIIKLKDVGQSANPSEESGLAPYEPEINTVVYDSGYVLNLSKNVNTDVIVGEDLHLQVDFLVSDKLGYRFYAYGDDLSLYSNYEIVVEYGSYDMLEDGTSYAETKKVVTYTSEDSTSKVFTYKEVAAYEMMLATKFTLNCYDANGNLARQKQGTITYASLVAQTLFNTSSNYTVYVDMLNYGAAVQAYFAAQNEGTDLAKNTASKGLPTDISGVSNYQQYATADDVASAPLADSSANTITVTDGYDVNIGTAMQILSSNRVVFVVDAGSQKAEDLTLKFTYGNVVVDTTVSDLEKAGKYYYYYPSEEAAIALYDVTDVVTAELYKGDTLLATKTYSIEAFVALNMTNSSLEPIGNTLMKFADSLAEHIENQPKLELATEIVSGNRYVIVNATTGTVMTKTFSSYSLLMGGTPSTSSDAWKVTLASNGKYVLPLVHEGETVFIQANDGNMSYISDVEGKIVFEYDEATGLWSISRRQDGSSSIYYFTLTSDKSAVTGLKNTQDENAYWIIYELKGGTFTDDEVIPEEPVEPEEPEEPEEPVNGTLVPVTSVEAGKEYVIVNADTNTVLTNTHQTTYCWYSEQPNYLTTGEPTAGSDTWKVVNSYSGNQGLKLYNPKKSHYMWLTTMGALAQSDYYALPVTFDYDEVSETFTIYATDGEDIRYLTTTRDSDGEYTCSIGLSIVESPEGDGTNYRYWKIYEVVLNDSGNEGGEGGEEGGDDTTDTPTEIVIPEGFELVTKLEDDTSYVLVNMATGKVWTTTYNSTNAEFDLGDAPTSATADFWQFSDGATGLAFVNSDGTTTGFYQPNGLKADGRNPITQNASGRLISAVYASDKGAWLIGRYSNGGTYYFIADAENGVVLSTAKLGDSDTIPAECYWIVYGPVSDLPGEGEGDEKYDDPNSGANFTFAFATDIHVGNGDAAIANARTMYKDFSKLIEEGVELDTVLISGDLTQNSYEGEWTLLLNAIQTWSPEGITTYTTLGNHDARSYDFGSDARPQDERWAEIWPRYQNFMSQSTGIDLTTPYYHVEIEGHNGTTYDLVVLCTETA